jgi:signal transduction histidine kinase
MREIKDFANSVIHDIKNPAIGMHTFARFLGEKYECQLDDQGKHMCDMLMKTAEHIVNLAEQINIFIKTREFPLELENINLSRMLDIIKESIATTLNVRSISWSQPENALIIKADRMSMHRIFRNLIDNALKYGGKELSRVIIEHREGTSFHYFSVSDNGRGIDEDDQEKVFELFMRTKSSRKIEGSGLGLAIVRKIVEKHGGKIRMKSIPGKGTTFFFSISKNI